MANIRQKEVSTITRNVQTSINDSNSHMHHQFIRAQQSQTQIPRIPVQQPRQQVPQRAPIVNHFHSKTVRQKFVFKVFAIFTTHLLLTAGIIILLLLYRKKDWIDPLLEHRNVTFIVCGISAFLLIIPFIVRKSCGGASFPSNYIWLLMFTAGLGLSLTFLSILLETYIALFAVVMASYIMLTLTLFCAQSLLCFNFFSGFFVTLLALIVSYFAVIHPHQVYPNDDFSDQHLPVLLSSGLIIGTVLIFRTCQVIDNKTDISPKDYVYTVLHLYVDVIIFVGLIAFIMVLIAHPRGRYVACRYNFRCGLLCCHQK